MPSSARHLVLHAAIVLLFGLLLGGPYARAINRGAAANIIHSWRVAHLSLPLGAILMLAIAPLLGTFAVPPAVQWTIAVALIVSAYGFCVSTPLAAITGERGLVRGASGAAAWVYAGNMLGVAGSVVSAVLLVYAAACSL